MTERNEKRCETETARKVLLIGRCSKILERILVAVFHCLTIDHWLTTEEHRSFFRFESHARPFDKKSSLPLTD